MGTYSNPVAWKPLCLACPPSPSSLPPYTAGIQTFLKFITLHYTPRRAWIHHCAFHGGEGRENVKSFTGERSVATAAGPDGHGRWDLLVPLSWKMDQITCYNQRNAVEWVHCRGVFCPHSNTCYETYLGLKCVICKRIIKSLLPC